MRCSSAAVALVASAAAVACGDTAVVVSIGGDLARGGALDTICLAVHDEDPSGGEFARAYTADELAELDELTLTVEPGGAGAGVASARGYLRGLELARDAQAFEFERGVGELELLLLACPQAPGGQPGAVGAVAAPAGARLAVSFGRGGTWVVAVGPGEAVAYRAGGGGLVDAGAALPQAPADVAAVIAFDADGDCDDDLVIAGASGLTLWRRDGASGFAEAAGAFAGAAGVAAAAADVDRDGDVDVVVGGGSSLALYRNDGTGEFAADGAAIPGGYTTDVTAIAIGDLDGDRHVDLVVGQGATADGFVRVLLNDVAGEGRFVAAPAALPEVPMSARAVAIADLDGDGYGDALVGAAGAPMRAYINRGDGRLEDQTFVVLPSQPTDVAAIAAAEWDGDCLVDLVVGFGTGDAVAWRGSTNGVFGSEALPGAASEDVALADVDDDGDRDLVLAGAGQIAWVRR